MQFGENHESVETGIEVVALRSLPFIHTKGKPSLGLVIHRTNFGECAADKARDGSFSVRRLLGLEDDSDIYKAHITLLSTQERVEEDVVTLCPMDMKGLIIKKN